jgi:alcohol dehydrogenase class IV
MNFEFATSSRIIFGAGRFGQLGDLARPLGQNALLVTGSHALESSGKLEALKKALAASGVGVLHLATSGEPAIESVEKAAASAREAKCDLVIAVGGGSVIDLAKAVAALLTNDGALLDYLEVLGQGRVLQKPAVPFIAVPTTAGTGAEVTANAVIRDPVSRQKVSLRSRFLLPTLAVVDPELTHSLSPEITAQSGLDALVHLVEAYTSKRAQAMTDLFCEDGISRIGRSLLRAYEGGNHDAREDMSMASLEGGVALANAGLGAVHGIAAILGGAYGIPHGLACACLLPHVVEANMQRLRSESPTSPVLPRYVRVFSWLAGRPLDSEDATLAQGVAFIQELNGRLGVPALKDFGVKEDDLAGIAAKSFLASSTRANPVTLSPQDLLGILGKALR